MVSPADIMGEQRYRDDERNGNSTADKQACWWLRYFAEPVRSSPGHRSNCFMCGGPDCIACRGLLACNQSLKAVEV
jgi:hypothetical protein